MLKQIPQETPAPKAPKGHHLASKVSLKKMLTLSRSKSQPVNLSRQRKAVTENSHIQRTLLKLFHYLQHDEKYSAPETEDLIHDLQRSILHLQKKRRASIQSQQIKRKSKK